MDPRAWEICKEKRRWGVKTSYPWNRRELERARRGDILLIHLNGVVAEAAICKVVSERMFDENTPIWPDEVALGKVLYPHRVEIDIPYELEPPLDTRRWFDEKPPPKIRACSNANDLRGFVGKAMVPLTQDELKYVSSAITRFDPRFDLDALLQKEPRQPRVRPVPGVPPTEEGVPEEAELEELMGPINTDLECMVREPMNELGVVGLFFYWHNDLGFPEIEFVRREFPDARVTERAPDGRLLGKYIEFEYKSSSYRHHTTNPRHSRRRCDYVVCWEHDWLSCPVPVIELRSKIPEIVRARSSTE